MPNPNVKVFIDWFAKTFQEKLGREYIVTGGKDGKAVKTLLKSLSLAELQEAAGRMLADSWGGPRSSIGLLASQINQWRAAVKPSKERIGRQAVSDEDAAALMARMKRQEVQG